MSKEDFAGQRKQLVKDLALKDKAVENAFLAVKREEFFPDELKQHTYVDRAFPIGFGQTISQPSTIAVMLEMLAVKKGSKVLEIGSGSGYVAALLSELVGSKGRVFAIEIVHELHQGALKKLVESSHENIFLKCGDGRLGWKQEAPFDGIIVSAACSSVPKTLIEQLEKKGKLVAPVGGRFSQEIVLLQNEKGKTVEKERRCCFVFVSLKGKFAD